LLHRYLLEVDVLIFQPPLSHGHLSILYFVPLFLQLLFFINKATVFSIVAGCLKKEVRVQEWTGSLNRLTSEKKV
jgi:hypothetical protein